MNPALPDRIRVYLVVAIITIGFGLRIWGITWGLPDQNRLLSAHPDEGVNLIQGALDKGEARIHPDLAFYNYGSLYFYMWQIGNAANHTLGIIARSPSAPSDRPTTDCPGAWIFVGRLISVVAGTTTILLVFLLGKRLFGETAGIASALFMAITPVAVVHSHYAAVDITATFLVVAALLAGSNLIRANARRWRTIFICGCLCGLAAATKYNAVVVIAAPIMAILGNREASSRLRIFELAALKWSAILGFLIGCPGIFLNWTKFWTDVTYEFHKSGEGMGLLFVQTGNGWWYHISKSMWFGLGPIFTFLVIVAVVHALTKRGAERTYLLTFGGVYFLMIGLAQVRFLRYILPMVPVLSLLAGSFLTEVGGKLAAINKQLQYAIGLVPVAVFVYSVNLVQTMAGADPRIDAAIFISNGVREGKTKSIAFATTPWYYTPPLLPEFTMAGPGQRRAAAKQSTNLEMRLPGENSEWDMAVFQPNLPDVVVLTNIESFDPIRIGLQPAINFIKVISEKYRVTTFTHTTPSVPIVFPNPESAPNDWLYIFPTVSVYSRNP